MPQSSSSPRPDLAPFFAPVGVAVVGASATPGKLGYGVLHNLIRQGYRGAIHPVNPRCAAGETLLGLPCYPDLALVPDPVDLAVIIVPAPAVAEVLRACARRAIPAAIILSGGFAEAGAEGEARQAEISAIARARGIRLIGPNCAGVLHTGSRLDATFIEHMPDPGPIAFLSQSGAIGGALIDWAKGHGVGVCYFASLGNMADVNESDLVAQLADDPAAGVIALYLEGLGDGRRFLEVAAQTARRKPIVVLKAGRTAAGAAAVSSHTASLAGSDAAYRAAFRQHGIVVADNTDELFGAAVALAYQPTPYAPAGQPRVAILTNAGGPGAIAADALADGGLLVPPPDPAALAALRSSLGPGPQLRNPFDLLGAASTPEFSAAARLLLSADGYDALLVVLVPNTASDPVGIADALAQADAEQRRHNGGSAKPIYVCYMGDISVRAGRLRLHQHRLPPFAFPEAAARALAAAWAWRQWQNRPPAAPEPIPALPAALQARLRAFSAAGRRTLSETELYPLLADFHLPLAPARLARSADEAAAHAIRLGSPVALKIASPDLIHKSDAGGVILGLDGPAAVAAAYRRLLAGLEQSHPGLVIDGALVQKMAAPGAEVIIGARRDPTFGPMLLFGGGGVYVEAFADFALRTAPLSVSEARAMLAETVAGRLLEGARGRPPADIDALARLMARIAGLACAAPQLAEIEFNPVIVHPAGQGLTIVDAGAVLVPAS
jgi:acetyltransferase